MRRTRKLLTATLTGCALAAATAHAAPVDTRDVTDFKYVWDFDLTTPDLNANFDLYNNTTGAAGADGTNDFAATYNNSHANISIDGGVLTVTNLGNIQALWSSVPDIVPTAGWTAEYRVRPDDTTGAGGILFYASPGEGATVGGFALKRAVDESDNEVVNIHWALSAASAATIQATVPADEFITIRVAAAYNSGTQTHDYTLYVNDQFVADLGAASPSTTLNRFLIARASSSNDGTVSIDYVAYTPGAYAPIPEPASVGLLGLGMATMFARRRTAR